MYSFPLEENEAILKKDLASYNCDGDVLSGAIYLTDSRLVFVGYALSITNKYMDEIPLSHIKELKPEKTFFVIPNVLTVTTIKNKTVKFVISTRNEWFDAVRSQLKALG